MILRKLTMSNFRQFKGAQQIEFACGSGPDGENVTVVFGENGRGKTGVFRAISVCLFGDRRLSQDGDVPDAELQLVNVSALEQSEGKPVETSVELDFIHKDRKYNLRRAIRGLQEGSQTFEELLEVKLVKTLPDGNSEEVDPADIKKVINSILDERVRDYFLFDGEKIERLTRASVEQRREIGKGIRNLLNVDALERARKATDKLTRVLEDELRKNASPELAKLLTRIGNNEQLQQEKKQHLEEVGEEATLARTEICKVDKALEAFKEIRDLLERRKTLEQIMQQLEQQATEQLSGMKSQTVKAARLLIAPTVFGVFEHIEKQKQKGDIPSEIRKDLIEKILSEERCICGNDVCEGTEAHARILAWLNRTADVTTQDAALSLWRDLSDMQSHLGDDASQIENCLIAYGNIRNDILSTRSKIDAINQQIGSSERQDATALDKHREKLHENIYTLEAESLTLRSAIGDLELELAQLTASLQEEKRRADEHDELTNRASLARDTRDALNTVYADFTKEIKDLIGKKATDLFSELLDSEGRENLRTVVVNDDYSLQVLDRWNRPFLANISAGQRQIMSISFIAALAQAASRDSLLEMPLFMDTPFGRLSYEHRQNLIRRVPEFSSQWILLATDTEFRKQEASLLRSGNKWGKFLMLRAGDDGNTTIEAHDVSTAQAFTKR